VPVDSLLYVSGSVVSVMGNVGGLAVDGYVFAGWSLSASGGSVITSFSITADVTLYGVWMSLDDFGDTSKVVDGVGPFAVTDSVDYLVTFELPTGLVFEGFEIVDTWVPSSGLSYVDFSFSVGGTVVDKSKITVTVGTGTVKFVVDDLSVLVGGELVSLVVMFDVVDTGVGIVNVAVPFVNGVPIGGGGEADLFKVTYAANWPSVVGIGVVPVDSLLYVSGSVVSVMGNVGGLAVDGYVFAGWSLSASGGSVGSSFVINADTTLYAVWRYLVVDVEVFTVTYSGNGNTGGVAPRDLNWYLDGETVTVLDKESLVKNGYTFLGWSTNSYATSAMFTAGSTFNIYGNVWLYAVWAQETYTVTYQPGAHGTFTAQVTGGLRYGDNTPAAPIVTGETGWNFTGWSPVPSATVTGNAVYVAQWSQVSTPSPTPSITATPAPTMSSTPTAPSTTVTPSVSVTPTTPAPSREGERVRPDQVDKWAIVNLVLSILGVVLAALVTVRALLLKKKEDEEMKQKSVNAKYANVDGHVSQNGEVATEKVMQRRNLWLFITLILGIVGVVVFLLTEDMSLPMGWVDKWTIVNAAILIVGIITAMFVFKHKKIQKTKTRVQN